MKHTTTVKHVKSRRQYEGSCDSCPWSAAGPPTTEGEKAVQGQANFHESRNG